MRAEVVEHLGKAHPEELFPEPIDEDARGQRIVLGGDPLREVEPREVLAFRRL